MPCPTCGVPTKEAGVLLDAGAPRAFADALGETNESVLLEQTLNEEKETDEKLSQLAEQINAQAAEVLQSEDAPKPNRMKRKNVA